MATGGSGTICTRRAEFMWVAADGKTLVRTDSGCRLPESENQVKRQDKWSVGGNRKKDYTPLAASEQGKQKVSKTNWTDHGKVLKATSQYKNIDTKDNHTTNRQVGSASLTRHGRPGPWHWLLASNQRIAYASSHTLASCATACWKTLTASHCGAGSPQPGEF